MSKIQEMNTPDDSMDNISVIIRNKNEAEYIGFAIQSVIDYFKNPQIIIVDNNSTDDSLEIAKLFTLHNDITIINIEEYSPGLAINMGVNESKNNTILILSAHAQITKMDFSYIKKCLNNNVAVFGKQTPIYRGKKITPRYIWSHFQDNDMTNMFSHIENRQFLHNAFCFYNKEHLMKYPFNENLRGKEDRYWAIDQVQKNYNYLYTSKIEVNHYWTSNGATWKGLG